MIPRLTLFVLALVNACQLTAAPAPVSTDPAVVAQRLAAIRTPATPDTPRINGTRIVGARPGKPFLHRIPTTGLRPMRWSARGLPPGLKLDRDTGIISGFTPAKKGTYTLRLHASNPRGKTSAELDLVVGDTLALTPPMGWNNYNAFRLKISDGLIRAQADAMVSSGLADHGYAYVNVDDAWEGVRAADGTLQGNERFPDMPGLGAHIHSHGLKFGIYSSPGFETCGGFLGSLHYEEQDARAFASWGVDYLKYDWCSYIIDAGRLAADRHAELLPAHADRLRSLAAEYGPMRNDRRRPRPPEMSARMREIEAEQKSILAALPAETLAAIERDIATDAYRVMGRALQNSGRDIVYSLCSYGFARVWEWGPEVGANLWRTTQDITPRWGPILSIINRQKGLEKWAGPGRWNDPDMLEIGNGQLTPDEMHMQMTQWCILAAPLLLGNDLTKLDPLVLSILTNDEVLAVNQDRLGRQGWLLRQTGAAEIYVKPLSGDRWAVALFNRGEVPLEITFDPAELELPDSVKARDLWRQKDLAPSSVLSATVAPHGAELYSLTVEKN